MTPYQNSDKASEEETESSKPQNETIDSEKAKEESVDGKDNSTEKPPNNSKRFRHVFKRPLYAEPRHPIFSSPFARHISQRAFGPIKPKWYTPLTTAEHYLFKDIMHHIEVARDGVFDLDNFSEALADFEKSITRAEIIEVLESMEKYRFEELDFGKFLFLLAYRDDVPDGDDPESTKPVTPRQCMLLSAISYFVLIASPQENERFYFQNTRRKSTVLHQHLETTRLQGLTEKQMEYKQHMARKNLIPLSKVSASPYTHPVPFVPSFKETKLYKGSTKLRRSGISKKAKEISRPIKPIEPKRKFKDPVTFKNEEERIYSQIHYGRIQLPEMKMPLEMLKEMRKGCTVEHKDFIMEKSYEAIAEYKERLKKAAVIYAKESLKSMLRKGFETEEDKEAFIEIYERYLPLDINDVKDHSIWVQPSGYQKRHSGKPLYPDQFAFGSKIAE